MRPECLTERYCPCGDRLIHQSQRGPDESSSLLGQWVHDEYPRTFDWMDIDGAAWKASLRRLVIFEHKYPGQQLRGSQRRVLPVFARLVGLGIAQGILTSGGAVLLYGKPPFDAAHATLYRPDGTTTDRDLSRAQLDRLFTAEPVPLR